MNIELVKENELEKVAQLYDKLNDYLSENQNYPGWKKGIYPTLETAKEAFAQKSLFAAKIDGQIAGTVILNNQQPPVYNTLNWKFDGNVLVIHTLAIDPDFMSKGVGGALLEFTEAFAQIEGYTSIRLDVSEQNNPAIKLYTKKGYSYVGKVDLSLENLTKGKILYECFEKKI